MMSQRPYWCTKHNETAAILGYKTQKTVLWRLSSTLMKKLSFLTIPLVYSSLKGAVDIYVSNHRIFILQ